MPETTISGEMTGKNTAAFVEISPMISCDTAVLV